MCEHDAYTKLEVDNILHYHQRTELRPQVTCTENFVKFENPTFDIYTADMACRYIKRLTNSDTDTLIAILPRCKVITHLLFSTIAAPEEVK